MWTPSTVFDKTPLLKIALKINTISIEQDTEKISISCKLIRSWRFWSALIFSVSDIGYYLSCVTLGEGRLTVFLLSCYFFTPIYEHLWLVNDISWKFLELRRCK
ncbi:hypothetical protein J6590_019547 [Homalodisca vitripennis]|nr:hypothetical protein J6590_019547 [Homalodisca vitripennis]